MSFLAHPSVSDEMMLQLLSLVNHSWHTLTLPLPQLLLKVPPVIYSVATVFCAFAPPDFTKVAETDFLKFASWLDSNKIQAFTRIPQPALYHSWSFSEHVHEVAWYGADGHYQGLRIIEMTSIILTLARTNIYFHLVVSAAKLVLFAVLLNEAATFPASPVSTTPITDVRLRFCRLICFMCSTVPFFLDPDRGLDMVCSFVEALSLLQAHIVPKNTPGHSVLGAPSLQGNVVIELAHNPPALSLLEECHLVSPRGLGRGSHCRLGHSPSLLVLFHDGFQK